MKRSFDPNEVIDLTQGEENESKKTQAKKPKRDRDLSNKNKGLLGRFDSAREQVQWYGNNGLQARAWGQQFQYREKNFFCNGASFGFGRGGFNQGQVFPGPSTSRHMINEYGNRQNNQQQRPDFHNRPNGYPRPRSHEDEFFVPGPDVFSHPSQQFRQALNPDPDSFRSEYDCGIFIFGSTFNGFGNVSSDMDMNIWLDRTQDMPDKEKLCAVRRLLRKFWSKNIRGGIELVPAKVPILKFKDSMANLDIDLSVNNPTSIRNTHLLYHYSTLDYRVRPLVNAVKCWAKSVGINDASCQTLSSYAWTLMVIHFLQFRAKPRVLPCLHDEYPQTFFARSNIFNLDYSESPSFKSENQQSLGDLMAQFFHYYAAEFDYERDVASIRKGCILEKDDCESYARSIKLSPGQWRAHMLLEEPFDRTNAARAVCNESQFDKIKTCIQDVYRYMNYLKKGETKDISLNDLCNINKANKHTHFN